MAVSILDKPGIQKYTNSKKRLLKRVYKNMVQAVVDNWKPKTKRDHIALMIAKAFDDLHQIKLYTNYCKKYSLTTVYRAFSEAKSFPEERIKKSRKAIFFYLVKRYAHQTN
jgi:ribosome maturation protein Sdo1